jgi:hypothetical protein
MTECFDKSAIIDQSKPVRSTHLVSVEEINKHEY